MHILSDTSLDRSVDSGSRECISTRRHFIFCHYVIWESQVIFSVGLRNSDIKLKK